MVHQLQEEIVLAEDVLPFGRGGKRLALLPQPQAGLHLTRWTSGGGDDAAGVLGDEVGVHARPLAQLPLERGQ
ncbi:Uncharacterised protein [Mycobacteroides abscessus]|nr:Uncharacterised protein [Mycobacteroides abscessus]